MPVDRLQQSDGATDDVLPSARTHVAAADPPSSHWTDTAPHPWRRYLARMLDIALLSTFSWVLIGFVLGALVPVSAERLFSSFEGRFGLLFSTLFSVPLAFIWCGVFVALSGGTPGKWLMGVRILDQTGRPPGLLIALEREAIVWIVGLGFGIPLVSMATMLASFGRLESSKTTWWDERLRLVVVHRAEGTLQTSLAVCAVLLWITTTMMLRFMQT